MPTVGLLILAAGASSRLAGARPKQLLTYRGLTLLRHAAETALASRCRPIVVVLGARAEVLRQELVGLPLTIALADRWEQGMGASLHAGLESLATLDTEHSPLDGVVVMVCDQPLLSAAHLDALVAASEDYPGALLASEYGGSLGVPALFPRVLFPDLRALPEGDGAKRLLQHHAPHAVRIPFPDGVRDIDTITDYENLISVADGG